MRLLRLNSNDPGIKVQLSDKRRFHRRGVKRGRPKAGQVSTKLRATAVITVYDTTLEELREAIMDLLTERSNASIRGHDSRLATTHQ